MCNGCEQKNKCRKVKYYYYSKFANDEYSEKLRTSRYGINLSKEEAYDIDTLITPLIKEKHQSISHVYANHPDEISFSRATMYKYVDLGVFSFRNIDLPRKVRYKKRKENEKQRIRRETAIRKGRTYEDFKEYIGKHPECSIVEMDTVEGIKGGKVFLTLLFRQSKFMLIYLMENKTMECVEKEFKKVKQILGGAILKNCNYSWIEFLSGRNVIKVTNESEFNMFKNFLKQCGLVDKHLNKYATQIDSIKISRITNLMFQIINNQKNMLKLIGEKLDYNVWQEINRNNQVQEE